MDTDFNSSNAFYALGTLFALFSVLYFGIEVILEISPAVKSAILLLASATVFSASGLTSSSWRKIPLYFLASFSYLIFVAYSLLRFDPGPASSMLILLGSTAVFMSAGYLVREKQIVFSGKRAKYVVAAGVFLMLGLFLFDVTGPQPEVQLQLRDSVDMTHGEETALGTVRVTNSFILPRGFEAPDYRACAAGDQRVSVYTEREGDTVSGKGTLEMELKARFYGPVSENETEKSGAFQVVRTEECIEKEGQISVYESYNLD